MKMKRRTYSGTTDCGISQRERKNRELARKAAGEGMVLLKNQGGLLPLKSGSRVALFGGGASRTVKGGTGSGDVNEREQVNIFQGMVNAGFEIATEKWIEDYEETYRDARETWKTTILKESEGKNPTEFFQIYANHPFRTPAGREVTPEDVEKAGTDTAVFVLSRGAGEAADREEKPGDYYLTGEEEAQLDAICKGFRHVVLIINTGAQVDLSFLETYENIEAILYMAQAGMEGGSAAADILSGKVNPSGKLTDTWGYRYLDYPAAKTFSHNNGNVEKEYYEEGIYIGYRHFDRFGITPRYPFGYGLSYTEFLVDGKNAEVKEENGQISISVPVKNTGGVNGREIVQVYISAPQTSLEKEYRRLAGYGKTALLAPGAEEKVKISVPMKCLASFSQEKHAWILEAGSYALWIGQDSRNLTLWGSLVVEEETILEETASICPLRESLTERKPEAKEAKEFEAAWRKEAEALKTLALHPMRETKEEEERPYTAMAKEVAEKLTDEELIRMVVGEVSKSQNSNALGSAGIMVPGAAGETSSVLEKTYGIPGLAMADGPAGLRLSKTYEVSGTDGSIYPRGLLDALEGGIFAQREKHPDAVTYYQYCTAIPVGVLLAQTWDRELLREVGRAVAGEMEEFGITWWLAPGMNLHRDPLCGRNFEYYSEDPVVSGLSAAAITEGVQSVRGVGTTIKHFACNNQEDNRKGSDSILTERTLRELYLRGFEIAVKEAKPMAIMTSYNLINGVHAANSWDLCTEVARKEWGFKGIIMTDWTTTDKAGGSTPHLCAAAGNDLIMPGTDGDIAEIAKALQNGSLSREDLKACVTRLIAMAYQSNRFEEV